MVNLRVAMDQLVSKSDYLWQMRNTGSQIRGRPGQLVQRFTNDFKLAFNRRVNKRCARLSVGIKPGGEFVDGRSGIAHIPKPGTRVTLHKPVPARC